MFFMQLLRDQQGATAIEYGLLAALIAITIIASLQSVGNEVNTTFTTVSGELETANAG